MSIPFYSSINMKCNDIENSGAEISSNGAQVIGGWHMYRDSDNLTADGLTVADYNNIKVGAYLGYPSTVDSSAYVDTMITYVSTSQLFLLGKGSFTAKTFRTGAEGIYTLSCDGNKVYKGSNLDEDPYAGAVACFTEDTLVLTENGLKPITDINVLDKVYSKNNSEEIELKEVDELISHTANRIYEIDLGNTLIKASWSHPFYVVGKGKVLAKDLQKFDNLLTINDSIVIIKDINIINIPTDVYEIRVKDNHNYFVSESKIFVYNEDSVLKED